MYPSPRPLTYTASMIIFHFRVAIEAMASEGFKRYRIGKRCDKVRHVRFFVQKLAKELVHKQLVRWAFSDAALLAKPTKI